MISCFKFQSLLHHFIFLFAVLFLLELWLSFWQDQLYLETIMCGLGFVVVTIWERLYLINPITREIKIVAMEYAKTKQDL